MPDEQSLEAQILSHEAERRVSQELDKVENININVQTDLLKIVQGQAQTVSVKGQGLVIKEDIRVQEIKLQTDSISINPFSALLGQIKLDEPVNAVARIILTESDINHAFKTDFIRNLAQNVQLNVDGETITLDLQEIQVFLPGDDKIEIQGKVLLKDRENTCPLTYNVLVRPLLHSKTLLLDRFDCTDSGGISLELIMALIQKIKELFNQPSFQWEDMTLTVKQLKLEKNSLTLLVEAYVRQIPSSTDLLSP